MLERKLFKIKTEEQTKPGLVILCGCESLEKDNSKRDFQKKLSTHLLKSYIFPICSLDI